MPLCSPTDEPALIDEVGEAQQDPESAAAYPVLVEGPSAVELSTQGAGTVTAALRAAGVQGDAAAAAGVPAAAAAWVVLPAVDADGSVSTVVLVNPGDVAAQVDLELLPVGGTPSITTITVPPRSVATSAPASLVADPAAIVVRCNAGSVVAIGVATTGDGPGEETAGYALSMGVPIES